MNKAILCAALALLFCWALPVQAKENKTLKIVYVEWDCATASSNLAKAVLEDRLGYKVELLPVTQPILWTSLASGDADAMVTAWLPDTHKEMYAKVKNQVEMLGKLTGGARLGLAVPDYVPLKSVEELSANAAKFKNRIIGIDPGAGIMQLTEKLLKDYNIKNMELVEGSGTIMTSSLADAIRNKEWIVVTAWSPHWMFGRWQLHYLDDPKASLGREEGIYKVSEKGPSRSLGLPDPLQLHGRRPVAAAYGLEPGKRHGPAAKCPPLYESVPGAGKFLAGAGEIGIERSGAPHGRR